ncbi:MAG TPA: FAD-dependent oxidoreductase, partial [Salinimicrobium sp.]|nr:FAD-dependent oxidoreductase [Salinimicrobium sp.]
MMRSKKIVIIGGGISGLCSAYYLCREGHQVTVIDKGDITSGASFINAGFIIPSHFTSLAAPGIISQGLKWMLNSNSPFYVKPRFDLEFFKWIIDFKRSATAGKVEKAIPVLKEINLKSQVLYEEMYSSLSFPFHYEKKGLLMAFMTAKNEEEEKKLAERAIQEGLEANHLSREELKKVQPGFSDQVMGAVHYKCDSHSTPGDFMSGLKEWLSENGVKFHLDQQVKRIISEGNKVTAVATRDGLFEAEEFVLAAG